MRCARPASMNERNVRSASLGAKGGAALLLSRSCLRTGCTRAVATSCSAALRARCSAVSPVLALAREMTWENSSCSPDRREAPGSAARRATSPAILPPPSVMAVASMRSVHDELGLELPGFVEHLEDAD